MLDDALVQMIQFHVQMILCLNPCYAGRCSSTAKQDAIKVTGTVSILVMLDDALVLIKNIIII